MSEEKNIVDKLIEQGFTKREIDAVIHKFILSQIKNGNKQQLITPAKNHPHPVVYFLRKVNIRKHVIGKALSLLESQFAKKPKNPV